jgi:3-hydroxyisobutyrate dehydrogenase-like beta-hydroxyacid dehydrogenase
MEAAATKIGFVGLGNIGKPMAMNLLKAGYDLMVHDLRPEATKEMAAAGAKTGASLLDIARHSDIIELVVMDDAQVEAVTMGHNGLVEAAQPGCIIAIHSTVLPDTVRRVAAAASARGVTVIDAQISGGAMGATKGTLCYMVGGDKAAFERCRPVFGTSGAHIFHLGELGAGATTKLVHNLVSYINMLATSEGMRMIEKTGIDVRTYCEVMHVSAGQSRATDNWLQRNANRISDPARPDRLSGIIHKDLRLALELGRQLGVNLPGAQLAERSVDSFM